MSDASKPSDAPLKVSACKNVSAAQQDKLLFSKLNIPQEVSVYPRERESSNHTDVSNDTQNTIHAEESLKMERMAESLFQQQPTTTPLPSTLLHKQPVLGQHHMDVPTDTYLEELTERVTEFDAKVQTDSVLDRPQSPLGMPAKIVFF